MTSEHETVLLSEAVDSLVVKSDGFYVDGTFGRGGHSQEILQRLDENGRLLAIDKDPEAIKVGEELSERDSRFSIVKGSFADMAILIKGQELGLVDGILLDLGVSSPQLDQSERGFSFMRDGPLDMRMDPTSGQSAAQWIATAEESEISTVLKVFGEERYAKRLAKALVTERLESPITTTLHLAKVIKDAHPAWERGKHPATKSFQAIRIFINNELGDLEQFLGGLLDILSVKGRIAVISFHSLEDRMIKRFIRRHVQGDDLPAGVPVMESQLNRRLKQVAKAVRAEKNEVDNNVRSRSAIMRVAEKIA